MATTVESINHAYDHCIRHDHHCRSGDYRHRRTYLDAGGGRCHPHHDYTLSSR